MDSILGISIGLFLIYLIFNLINFFTRENITPKREAELKKYLRIIFSSLNKNLIYKQQLHPLAELKNKIHPKYIFHRFKLSRSTFEEKKKLRIPYISEIVRFCLKQYEQNHEKIKINFFKMNADHAANIRYTNNTWYIKIDEKYIDNDTALISIIAHEMAHYALLKNNIFIETDLENEELTDTTAIIAGFGQKILAAKNTWRVDPYDLSYQEVSLGYLSKADIKFLIKLKKYLLRKRIFNRYQTINTSLIGSIKCFICDIQLNLPKKIGQYIIKCPICQQKQKITITNNDNLINKVLGCLDKVRIKL